MDGKDVVSIKDFIFEKFLDLEKRTEGSRVSMEKRLDGMNEFRDTLRDQAARFITRAEYDMVVTRHDEELHTIKLQLLRCLTRDEHTSSSARDTDDIRELREAKAKLEGKADQSSVNNVTILAVIGMIISAVSVVISLVK